MRFVSGVSKKSLLPIAAIITLGQLPCSAQAIPDTATDRALGTTVETLSPTLDLITGGTRPSGGINLFHSFAEFNIPAGHSVYFDSSAGVQNILARVTGPTSSTILGTLGSLGSANLFLFNPNGIVFGENAVLSVGGSFVGTTANAVALGEGRFSATNPQSSVLLNINPSALLINQLGQSGDIEVNRSFLFGSNQQSLALIGGAVRINEGYLGASDGHITIGGLAAPGTVTLPAGSQTGFGFPDLVARADVSITDNTLIGVSRSGSGTIDIRGRNVDLVNSSLLSGAFAGSIAVDPPGQISIDATDAVTLTQQSTIGNLVTDNAVVDGGGIDIKAGSLSILGGSFLNTFHSGQGNGGNITINARDQVLIRGASDQGSLSSISTTGLRGKGNSGDIIISAGSLALEDSGRLISDSNRLGNGGNVTLNIKDQVTLDGASPIVELPSGIFTELGFDGQGRAGNIQLTAQFLSLSNGGAIGVGTFGLGDGGSVVINARDQVLLDGVFVHGPALDSSEITSRVYDTAIGQGGTIQITAPSVTVRNGAALAVETAGVGNSGNILITARDRVAFDGQSEARDQQSGFPSVSSASTSVLPGAVGNGGKIEITAGSLDILRGGGIFADTGGQGKGGQIEAQVQNQVLLDGLGKNGNGSTIRSDSFSFSGQTIVSNGGDGGNIGITANTLIVRNGGTLSSVTNSPGNAGNINLFTRDALIVQGANSYILAAAGNASTGQGGNLQITARQLSLLDQSTLSVGNIGTGNAGTLGVSADQIRLDNKSVITSVSTSGSGGDVTLTAKDLLLLRRGSFITTSAVGNLNPLNSGNGGNININTKFLVSAALENSDIVANALQGRGGNVTINAQAIFGFIPRSRAELVQQFGTADLSLANLDQLTTNDIIAISRANPTLNGQIQLNLPDVDPSQGLVALPANLLDRSAQVQQGCQATASTARSSFINSGRGGVPASPADVTTSATSFDRWVTLNPALMTSAPPTSAASISQASPLVEAQGWVRTAGGDITLFSANPVTLASASCR